MVFTPSLELRSGRCLKRTHSPALSPRQQRHTDAPVTVTGLVSAHFLKREHRLDEDSGRQLNKQDQQFRGPHRPGPPAPGLTQGTWMRAHSSRRGGRSRNSDGEPRLSHRLQSWSWTFKNSSSFSVTIK